jgi:hypothetical protein
MTYLMIIICLYQVVTFFLQRPTSQGGLARLWAPEGVLRSFQGYDYALVGSWPSRIDAPGLRQASR